MMTWKAMTILGAAICATTPVAAQDESITVTIRLQEEVAIPGGAILEVALLDVSRADAPSETIATRRFWSADYPARVELPYDAAEIDARMSYVVSASIRGESSNLLLRTTSSYPVLTRGAGNEVEILLEAMPGARTDAVAGAPILAGTKWRSFEIRGRMFVGEEPPSLSFGEGGSFALYGGCNRFTGQAAIGRDRIAFPDVMAGTRMACPEQREKLEADVLEALKDTTGYVLGGNQLAFVNGAGVTVLRYQRSE
ncbi:YbaY family lipoprotein [Halovulum sp. GXIMD14794]